MQLRDPLPFLVALMGVFAVVVLYMLAGRMGETPDAIASDIAALPVLGTSAAASSNETVEVEIPEGAGAEQIIALLLQAGVLADSSRFDTLLAFSGVAPELQAGSYASIGGHSSAAPGWHHDRSGSDSRRPESGRGGRDPRRGGNRDERRMDGGDRFGTASRGAE